MTGLQMQLLMSLHMHSQTNKQTNKLRNALSLEFCFCVCGFFFIKKTNKKQTDHSGTKQTCISNKWQHLKNMCQCLFFFDFLWDLCGDRDWDLDFFPDFLGDLDRERLDLLGVLEPDGDLKKQTSKNNLSTCLPKLLTFLHGLK